jgi:hypothetical protein
MEGMIGPTPHRSQRAGGTDGVVVMHVGGATCVDDEFVEGALVPAPSGGGARALLLGGAHALHVDGDLQASREWYDAAYQTARREADGCGMARAALGLAGLWVHENRSAAAAVVVRDRLEQALRAVDPGSTLAVRLRTRLAGEADYRVGGNARILAALEDARRNGDPIAIAEAASLAHHCLLGPAHGSLRHDLAEELIALGARTGRRSDLLMGLVWRTVDLILDGDPHAERCLAELRDLLDAENHLAVRYVLRAIEVMLDIRAGRFAEAEAGAVACAEAGRGAGDADATGWFGAHMVAIRWYQGRIGELVPTLREIVNSPTLSAIDHSHVAGLAVAAAATGDRRDANGALARLGACRFDRLPESSSWLVSMYGIVEAANLVGDVDSAQAAYGLLRPYAGLPMVASIGVACFGSVQHALGVASMTLGETDRAIAHLRTAVCDNLALGHWPATVLSRVRLAEALAHRSGPGDLAEAEQTLGNATREAAGMGMPLPASVTAMRSGLVRAAAGVPTVESGLRAVAGRVAVTFGRQGRHWQVAFGHHTAVVENCLGMRYLATLTANPGYDMPAIDLAAGSARPLEVVVDRGGSSHQPVLDEVAMREYRQRLAALAEEIDKYELSHDERRAEVARAERDWLIAELTAAAGLGGRVREFTSGEERARISVGKAIRRAIDRVTVADAAIGDELRATVQTGLRCCYRPR